MLTDQDNEHLHRGDVLPRGQRVPTGVLPARACFGARRGWSERWGRASSRSTPHHPKRCEWIGGRLTAGRKRTSRLTPKARAVLHLSDSRAFAVPQHLPAGFYAPTSVPAHAQQHVLQLPTAPHTKQQQQHHSLQSQVGLTSMIMSNVSPSFTRWIAARLPTPFRTVLFRMRST